MLKDEVRTLSYRNSMWWNKHLFKYALKPSLSNPIWMNESWLMKRWTWIFCLGTRSFWMLDVEREFYQCLLLKRGLRKLLVYVLSTCLLGSDDNRTRGLCWMVTRLICQTLLIKPKKLSKQTDSPIVRFPPLSLSLYHDPNQADISKRPNFYSYHINQRQDGGSSVTSW